jgi:hypothetical protein
VLLRSEVPGDAGRVLDSVVCGMYSGNRVPICRWSISVVSRITLISSRSNILHVGTPEHYPGRRFRVPVVYYAILSTESENRECVNAGKFRDIPRSVRSRMCDCVPDIKERRGADSERNEERAVSGADIAGVVVDGDGSVTEMGFTCFQCGIRFLNTQTTFEAGHAFCTKSCLGIYRLQQKRRCNLDKKDRRILKDLLSNIPEIKRGTCCVILRSHADALKDDPERLSTKFIKKVSHCECDDDQDKD